MVEKTTTAFTVGRFPPLSARTPDPARSIPKTNPAAFATPAAPFLAVLLPIRSLTLSVPLAVAVAALALAVVAHAVVVVATGLAAAVVT